MNIRSSGQRWVLGTGIALLAFFPDLSFASTNVPGPINNGTGQPVWTLYTIGAGPALFGLLNSIKLMVSQNGYKDLLLFVAIIGFLVNATSSVIRGQPHRLAGTIILILFVSNMAYDINIDIQIDDQASNYVNVVQGVPALIGLPAALISRMGYFLTQETEQDFNLPGFSALELTNGGLFNMSAAVVNALDTPVINDIPLRTSFNYYFNDCVVPALANGTISAQQIGLASPGSATGSLINVFAAAGSRALLTTSLLPNGTPSTVTCNAAYSSIQKTINTDYPNLLTQTMGQAYQVYGATGAAASLYSTAITSGFNWLNGNNGSPSAQSLVIQSAMMDLTRGGFAFSAAQTGGSSIVNSINLQEAYRQQQSSWWAASQLFSKIGPMFYVVLYAFVVGLAPFIIIGMFIPRLGGMMAMSYFQILVWLALWQPAFSILNYIMALFEQNSSTEVMTNMGTWSLQSHTVLNQAANNYILVAGFLATLTPMILFALVKSGSMAFTGFLEAASSKSAALQAANGMSSGNLSLGQDSIDNTNMNKYDITRSASFGSSGVVANEGFAANLVKQDFGGNMAMEGGSSLGSITRQTQTTGGHRDEASLSAQSVDNYFKNMQGGVAWMRQDLQNWRQGKAGRQTADGLLEFGQTATDQQEYRKLQQLLHSADVSTTAATGSQNSVQTGASGRVGVGTGGGEGGGGPSASAGLSIGATSTDSASQSRGDGLKAGTNNQVAAGHTTAVQHRAAALGKAAQAYQKLVEAFHNYGLINGHQYHDMMGHVEQFDRTARSGETDTFGTSATTTTTTHSFLDAAEVGNANFSYDERSAADAQNEASLARAAFNNGNLENQAPRELAADKAAASQAHLPPSLQQAEATMQADVGQYVTPAQEKQELQAMAEVGRYQSFMSAQKAIVGNGDRDVSFVSNNAVANAIGNKDHKAGDATGIWGHVENLFEGIAHPGTSEGLNGQTGNPRTLSTPFGEIAKLNMSDPAVEGQFQPHPIPGMQVVGIFQPKNSSQWQALYQQKGSNTTPGGSRTYYTVGNNGEMTSISERSVREPTGTQRQFFVQSLSAQENWGQEPAMVRNASNGMAEASNNIAPTYSVDSYSLSKDGTVFTPVGN